MEKPPRDGEAARASSWNANAEEEEEEEVRALPVNGAADAPTSRWMTLVPLCTIGLMTDVARLALAASA